MPKQLRVPKRRPYKVSLGEEGGRIEFDDEFWNTEQIDDEEGTTAFDYNVEYLLAELRVSLHWISTQRERRH